MQKDSISVLTTTSAVDSAALHFSLINPFLSPTTPTDCLKSDASLYSPISRNYAANYLSDIASFDGGDIERRYHDPSSILEYQQLYNSYLFSLSQLRKSVEEVDALRRENDRLRQSNTDLSHRVAFLLSRNRLLSELNNLSINSPAPTAGLVPVPVHVASPQPLPEHNCFERRNNERVSLPKSISVRSKGYLKMNRPGQHSNLPNSVQTSPQSQRVYVPGAKEEEEALELDVYNEGMSKTELCNKWEETGACPYGDNCQFAHGVKELRPLIRHPRYKTEVCRMVLAGDTCPYGHRCHFRHSLTEQERLMMAASSSSSSLPPPPC